jgi:lipoic acid synthetase
MNKEQQYDPTQKARGLDKLSKIPIKIAETTEVLRKPDWIRIKLSSDNKVSELKQLLRDNRLVTVCEEASCPNLSECFSHGTATFMIMGDKCTRRCSFCAVGHGRPDPLDPLEPVNLANTVEKMRLKYVVITSVDRDDLRDGGAAHFSECIKAVREKNSGIKIEVLVPDFRGRMEKALAAVATDLPDVFNHNIETVPRLYKAVRPGADFAWSLKLLQEFKKHHAAIPSKSGIMLGLGETNEEVREVLQALRDHDVEMVTIGQYLQPTRHHHPVMRYVPPQEFAELAEFAKSIGFSNVASGPLVRSSYHADLQASGQSVC